jgi:nitrite reductase/ring-hydroxylating ferredoxin subunit
MGEHIVAGADELSAGERLVVEIKGREIAVFNIQGELHAYLNWCMHQCGPCCEGSLTGTTEASFDRDSLETQLDWSREGEILNCPWHGWEYDIKTGECLSNKEARLPSYPIEIKDGDVVISM